MKPEITVHQLTALAEQMVEHESSEASWQLCQYAERHGSAARELVGPFTAALRSLKTRDAAAFGLAAIGPDALPAVSELLAAMHYEPDDYCINPFVVALGAIGPSANEAVSVLIDTLRSAWDNWEWSVARDAAEALGKIGAKEALPLLRVLLDPDSPPVREALVATPGHVKTQENIQEARKELEDAIRRLG